MHKRIILSNLLKPYKVGDLIRLGSHKDGGYLLSKKSLSKSNFLISLGIAYNWDFERDFLKKNKKDKLSIVAYDNSISLDIIKKFSLKSLLFFFLKPSFKKIQHMFKYFSYISTFDGKKAIHYPLNISRTNTKKTNTLKKIFNLTKKKTIILKIDIEGNEYLLLNDILTFLNRINVLIIEFHYIQRNKTSVFKFIKYMSKKFYISHIHVNNVSVSKDLKKPEIIEFTFEKKTMFSNKINYSNENYPLKNLDYPSSRRAEDSKIIFK